MASSKATPRQIRRIEMFAGLARACVPELCEQASDGRAQIPHRLTQVEAERVIETLKAKARRTDDHEQPG